MAVSVVTFKTGDRVITELKEIFDEEGKDRKGICLLMEEPYILSLDGSTPQYLTEQSGMDGEIRWTFEKFLLDRDGNLVRRYRSGQDPDEDPLFTQIETLL